MDVRTSQTPQVSVASSLLADIWAGAEAGTVDANAGEGTGESSGNTSVRGQYSLSSGDELVTGSANTEPCASPRSQASRSGVASPGRCPRECIEAAGGCEPGEEPLTPNFWCSIGSGPVTIHYPPCAGYAAAAFHYGGIHHAWPHFCKVYGHRSTEPEAKLSTFMMWEDATRSLHTLPWYFELFGVDLTIIKSLSPVLEPHGFELVDVLALEYAVQRDERVIRNAVETLKLDSATKGQPPPDAAFQTEAETPLRKDGPASPEGFTHNIDNRCSDAPGRKTGFSDAATQTPGYDGSLDSVYAEAIEQQSVAPLDEESHRRANTPSGSPSQSPSSAPVLQRPYFPDRKAQAARCVHPDTAFGMLAGEQRSSSYKSSAEPTSGDGGDGSASDSGTSSAGSFVSHATCLRFASAQQMRSCERPLLTATDQMA